VQRSTAQTSLPYPAFPSTIQASLRPDGDKLAITWYVEGARIEAPPLSLPDAPPQGSAQLGGAHSLPGVYDGFGVMVNSASPAYRLASRRKYKSSLVLAEAFEDGALPPLSTATGQVNAGLGSLTVREGGALALSPVFGVSSTLVIESDFEGDRDGCELVLSGPDLEALISVSGSGVVRDSSGKQLGVLSQAAGKIAFRLDLQDGNLKLRGSDSSESIVLSTASKRFVLSLESGAGADHVDYRRVLVRAAAAARK
jgi:hypothetical protein